MIRLKVVVVLMLLRVARAWWFCLRSNGRSNWSRSLGDLGALAGDWRVVVIYPCLVNYYAQAKGSERDNNRVSEVDPGPCSLPRGCSPHLIVALDMTISQPFQYLIGPSHILTKQNPSKWPPKHPNSAPSTAASCARCRPASPPSSPTRLPCKSTSAPTSPLNRLPTLLLSLTNCKPSPQSQDCRKPSRSCNSSSSSAFTLRWLRDTTRAWT